jgi:DNA-binding MarR family transcriptional regulator
MGSTWSPSAPATRLDGESRTRQDKCLRMQATSARKLQAWEAFLRAHAALLPILSRELERAERIPLNYYDVLVQLADARQRCMRLHELNRCIVLSQSALSRLVDRMQTDGLVARKPDPDDRRGTIVSITRQGLGALRRAAPVHLASIERHFARYLSEEEAAVLAAVLERVRTAAGDRASTPPSTT